MNAPKPIRRKSKHQIQREKRIARILARGVSRRRERDEFRAARLQSIGHALRQLGFLGLPGAAE